MPRVLSALVVAWLLWAQPAAAACAFVSRANTPTHTAATTVISPAQSHTTGNTLAALMQFQGPTISSVTDTAGNTYTATTSSPFTNVGGTNRQAIWYAKNITGNASNQVTATFAASYAYLTITVYEFSGCDTVAPFIADSTGTSASGTAIATGTLTLSTSSVIVAIYESDAGPGSTGGTGYTKNTADDNGFISDEYHITSTSEAASATGAGSAGWGILGAAFVSSGGPPPAAAPAPCVLRLLGVGCEVTP